MSRRKQARAARRGAVVGATVAAAVPLPGARIVGAAVGGLVGWLAATPAEREGRSPPRGVRSPLLLDEDDVQLAVATLREAVAVGQAPAEAVHAPPVARLLLVRRVAGPRAAQVYAAGLRQAVEAAAARGTW
jgi:hypothetical protein